MSNIVLLGCTGFVGSSLLKKMKNEKFRLKAMIHNNGVKTQIEKFKGDILSQGIFDKELKRGDTVINLIGQNTGNLPDLINLNITGGLNLLNSCIKKKLNRIILISSINVYGENSHAPSKEMDPLRPQTVYGVVKLLTEKMYESYSKVYGINVTILRLANLYGPNKKSGFIANLINSINNNKQPLTVYSNAEQLRDLLYVEDATDAIIQAIKIPLAGFNVLNISSGNRYMIKDLIKIIEKTSHKKLNVKLSKDIFDEKCIWANNSKAKKFLKFIPKTTIENGLKLTINNLMKKN